MAGYIQYPLQIINLIADNLAMWKRYGMHI